MQLKRYTVYAALFIALVGAYAYTNIGGEYSVDIPFLGLTITLAVAIWLVLPLLLLYLLTATHISFAKIKEYFYRKKYEKDHKQFIEFIKRKIVGEAANTEFKTDEYRELYHMLMRAKLYPDISSQRSGNESLDTLLDDIAKIFSGEYVDIKKYGLESGNEIVLKNRTNRLKEDSKFAHDILKKEDEKLELKKVAFERIVTEKQEKEIKRYLPIAYQDRELIERILKMIFTKEIELELTNEEILNIVKSAKFTTHDIIELAKISKSYYTPDSWLKLFEYISENYEQGEDAYIYVLFDLEMIERASERLGNTSKDEMQKFKAYLSLKESGKHYPIDLFV